jgi:GntR family transcriptional repressor for pyruvate dehydrogenase complex
MDLESDFKVETVEKMVQQLESLLKPIEKQTLTRTVIERLLEFIQAGDFRAGQPLPSQHVLAEQLSVSRPVLREAMQGLASMGVVEIRPGSGCYVKDSHANAEPEALFDFFTHDGAIEVLYARLVIEGELASMAAVRATNDDLNEMNEILERLKRAVARGRAIAHITSDFHQALARAGHNRPLYRMAQLLTQARIVQGLRVEHALPEVAAHEYDSHRLLLEAVASRDPLKARTAMREHLEIAHGWEEQIESLRSQIEAAEPMA